MNSILTFEFVPNEPPGFPQKEYKPYIGLETPFTISCATFLKSINADFTHVPNERKTEIKISKKGVKYSPEWNKLLAMGVKPGTSDLVIWDHRRGYCGFVIELKVGRNKPSDAQLEFLEARKKQGWLTLVTWSLDEFIDKVEWYYGIETVAQLLRNS